jgi:hypothetical protein
MSECVFLAFVGMLKIIGHIQLIISIGKQTNKKYALRFSLSFLGVNQKLGMVFLVQVLKN